jgi:hypothetical protein
MIRQSGSGTVLAMLFMKKELAGRGGWVLGAMGGDGAPSRSLACQQIVGGSVSSGNSRLNAFRMVTVSVHAPELTRRRDSENVAGKVVDELSGVFLTCWQFGGKVLFHELVARGIKGQFHIRAQVQFL